MVFTVTPAGYVRNAGRRDSAVGILIRCGAMRRRVFSLVCFGSLLAYLACAVLWVRSYWVADRIRDVTRLTSTPAVATVASTEFASSWGGIYVIHVRTVATLTKPGMPLISNVPAAGWRWGSRGGRIWTPRQQRLGFAFETEQFPGSGPNFHRFTRVRIPWGAPLVLSAGLCVVAYWGRRRLVRWALTLGTVNA